MRAAYKDTFRYPVKGHQHVPIVAYARAFFSAAPSWVVALLGLRNKLASYLGLKASKVPTDRATFLQQCAFEKGDEIGLFRVMEKSMDQIILGQDDQHLDFRICIQKIKQNEGLVIEMETRVSFHNAFGRLYFLIVKPFHRLIAPRLLKRMIKAASGDEKTASRSEHGAASIDRTKKD
ncbi:MAG: DUF2867 domain-containing protein [Bacteroidota bacterium]